MAVTELGPGQGARLGRVAAAKARAHYGKPDHHGDGPHAAASGAVAPALAVGPARAPNPKAAAAAARAPQPHLTFLGTALFGGLLALAGAAPWALPRAFLLFAGTALPWRAWRFAVAQPRNAPFLLDFCYAVNAAVAAFLCLPPGWRSAQLEGAVYALADGPVAGALVAWQVAWLFASADHTVSVLVHLLPGLAMAAHRHVQHGQSAGSASAAAPALEGRAAVLWLLAAPLAFYAAWQAAYFLLVQVLARGHIVRRRLDTSYRCLTRRAARADNVWARLVLCGGVARRLVAYGLLQLAFTVCTLLLFLPTYFSPRLACLWQAAKFLVPVWYGCQQQAAQLGRLVAQHTVQVQVDARSTVSAAQPGWGAVPPVPRHQALAPPSLQLTPTAGGRSSSQRRR
ncbi:hypothetical protein ABPG77_011334 [Micractinium sp. CCAP 211/92]